jgi:hypothetical protein
MSYLVSPDRHSAFGGVASTVLLTALLTAPAANAAGGEETICDLSFGTPSGNDFRQHGVATFDSAIRDGLMVTVGDPVALDPVTGSIALEGEFADILLANGVTSAEGDGVLSAALPRRANTSAFLSISVLLHCRRAASSAWTSRAGTAPSFQSKRGPTRWWVNNS